MGQGAWGREEVDKVDKVYKVNFAER